MTKNQSRVLEFLKEFFRPNIKRIAATFVIIAVLLIVTFVIISSCDDCAIKVGIPFAIYTFPNTGWWENSESKIHIFMLIIQIFFWYTISCFIFKKKKK